MLARAPGCGRAAIAALVLPARSAARWCCSARSPARRAVRPARAGRGCRVARVLDAPTLRPAPTDRGPPRPQRVEVDARGAYVGERRRRRALVAALAAVRPLGASASSRPRRRSAPRDHRRRQRFMTLAHRRRRRRSRGPRPSWFAPAGRPRFCWVSRPGGAALAQPRVRPAAGDRDLRLDGRPPARSRPSTCRRRGSGAARRSSTPARVFAQRLEARRPARGGAATVVRAGRHRLYRARDLAALRARRRATSGSPVSSVDGRGRAEGLDRLLQALELLLARRRTSRSGPPPPRAPAR